jgi:hypothetical protein
MLTVYDLFYIPDLTDHHNYNTYNRYGQLLRDMVKAGCNPDVSKINSIESGKPGWKKNSKPVVEIY